MATFLKIVCPINPGVFSLGKILCLMGVILAGFCFFPGPGLCNDLEKTLDFTLPAPEDDAHKSYLGLKNQEPFSLGHIQADIVIIEIFSMYCPICQREASRVNSLFALIKEDPSLKDKVKLLGVGAGNSSFEVNFFKEKYKIEFPLFSDPDFIIHKKIGEKRTPHFFGLALDGKGSFKVFYSQSGEVSDPAQFLEILLKDSGIKK